MKIKTTLIFLLIHCVVIGQNHSITFEPSEYHRAFSSKVKPALNIKAGDTIYSESIDAGGYDKAGKKVSEGGNPLTGPFFIEGAEVGDVVAVTILKIALNRSYATTFEVFVPRSLPNEIVNQLWRKTEPVDWHLDLEKGIGTPKVKHEHLSDFNVPLNPFLGCVGLAPAGKEVKTYDAGSFGGNLDFNRIKESSIIYLPVQVKGGLLFLGDAHAAQGDGELTGSALETSIDFAFTVSVIKNRVLAFPRVEDEEYIMAIGLAKHLDDALKLATKNLLDWLQADYSLSLREATQVIGFAVEYRIPEIADPKVEVVAMIKKDVLKVLKKVQ